MAFAIYIDHAWHTVSIFFTYSYIIYLFIDLFVHLFSSWVFMSLNASSISSIRALEEELDVDVEMLNWEDLYSAVRQLAMLGIAGKEWHFGPSSNSSWKSHCFWGQKTSPCLWYRKKIFKHFFAFDVRCCDSAGNTVKSIELSRYLTKGAPQPTRAAPLYNACSQLCDDDDDDNEDRR